MSFSISRLCFEGPRRSLQLTENTQPAILTVSVAAFRAMQVGRTGPAPASVAGHSLGEYSALVAAGALSLVGCGSNCACAWPLHAGGCARRDWGDGCSHRRGACDIEAACDEASRTQVCAPANINSPNQVVIAGNAAAVDRAMELLKDAGAKRVIKLNVSAPFHCALMKPAQERLAFDLEQLAFSCRPWYR